MSKRASVGRCPAHGKPSVGVVIAVITAEGGRGRKNPQETRERVSDLTSCLPEVTFKLSAGTKGVSVALDEPDVTGGEKG